MRGQFGLLTAEPRKNEEGEMKKDRLERRIEDSRKRLLKLEKQLAKATDYKARVTRFEEEALAEYRKDRISYEQYLAIVNSKHEGKTREEWSRYYDDYIERCRKEIEETRDLIDKTREHLEKESRVNYGLWITVIAAIIGLVFMFGPALTGFVTAPANVTVLNVAPNVTTVTLTPATAYTNNTLTCTPTTEDWNGDTVTSYYRWFTNETGVDAKKAYTLLTLHHSNFSATDRIRCQVTPSDGVNGLNGTPKNASITISNLAPIVTLVEIGDHGQSFNYVVTPVAGQNASVAIRASVVDGDCNRESNLTAYICDTTIANECSQTTFNYSKVLVFQRTSVSTSECYFTFNGTSNMPQFWRTPGTWTWNITVRAIDNSTGAALNARNFSNFTYNSLQAINYATRLYLGNSSSLTLEKWATNTTARNLTNFGNVRLKLQWNVSNALRLGGGGTWTIINDFLIDDDRNYTQPGSDSLMRFVNLSSTLKQFNQSSGLQTCTNDNCNNGLYKTFTRNETLETYFHIKPPAGLASGAYSSKLWIVTAAA